MATQDTDLLTEEAEQSSAGTSNSYSSGSINGGTKSTPTNNSDGSDNVARQARTAGAASGGAGFAEAAGERLDEAKGYAKDMAGRAKEQGRNMFDEQKDNAAGKVDSAANAFRNTAEQLQGEGQSETGRYVGMVADRLENFGNQLRNKNLDVLIRDTENIARKSPGVFVAGSVLAGFVLARFLKSSAERAQQSASEDSYVGGYGTGYTQSDFSDRPSHTDRSSHTDASGRVTYDEASYDSSDGASLSSSPTLASASGFSDPDLSGSVTEGGGVASGPNTGAPSTAAATPMATANESLAKGAAHDNR
jgi:uncharacterized protein YjbJ (UPF0337 family)